MANLSIVSFHDPDELAAHREAWSRLASEAAEANVFYEPWLLLPALRHLEAKDVEVALAFEGDELRAVFPLQLRSRHGGLPVRSLSFWHHPHCYLCTPLVHRDRVDESVKALLDWMGARPGGPRLLVTNRIAGDGPVSEALRSATRERRLVARSQDFLRAVYTPRLTPAQHLGEALSGKHRREFSRLEKRLTEVGKLTYGRLPPEASTEEVRSWIKEFLELEASGWKKTEGTALICSAADTVFFEEIVHGAHALGKLTMIAGRLDGKAFTMKCEFTSGEEGFSFKIAYDDALGRYRPGVQLQLWHIAELHRSGLRRVDSCAEAGSVMLERIWLERRLIRSSSLGLRLFPEGLWVAAIPLLKRLRERLRKGAPALDERAPSGSASSGETGTQSGM